MPDGSGTAPATAEGEAPVQSTPDTASESVETDSGSSGGLFNEPKIGSPEANTLDKLDAGMEKIPPMTTNEGLEMLALPPEGQTTASPKQKKWVEGLTPEQWARRQYEAINPQYKSTEEASEGIAVEVPDETAAGSSEANSQVVQQKGQFEVDAQARAQAEQQVDQSSAGTQLSPEERQHRIEMLMKHREKWDQRRTSEVQAVPPPNDIDLDAEESSTAEEETSTPQEDEVEYVTPPSEDETLENQSTEKEEQKRSYAENIREGRKLLVEGLAADPRNTEFKKTYDAFVAAGIDKKALPEMLAGAVDSLMVERAKAIIENPAKFQELMKDEANKALFQQILQEKLLRRFESKGEFPNVESFDALALEAMHDFQIVKEVDRQAREGNTDLANLREQINENFKQTASDIEKKGPEFKQKLDEAVGKYMDYLSESDEEEKKKKFNLLLEILKVIGFVIAGEVMDSINMK